MSDDTSGNTTPERPEESKQAEGVAPDEGRTPTEQTAPGEGTPENLPDEATTEASTDGEAEATPSPDDARDAGEVPIVDALNRDDVPDADDAAEKAGLEEAVAPASAATDGKGPARTTEKAAAKAEGTAEKASAAAEQGDNAEKAGTAGKPGDSEKADAPDDAAKPDKDRKPDKDKPQKSTKPAAAQGSAPAAAKPPRVKKPRPGRKEQRESMARRGRIAARSVTASLAVLLVGALTVGAQVYLPASPSGTARDAVTAQVPAADLVTSCAGPAGLSSGITPGTDAAFTPDSSSAQHWFDIVSAPYQADGDDSAQASAFGVDALGKDALGASVLAKDAGAGGKAVVARKQPLAAGLKVLGHVAGGEPAQVQTVQTSLSSDGDLRGLATESCGQIGADFWLVGGSTEVGRSTRLVLSNPTQTAANVAVDVFGAKGRIETPTAEDLLVPPGTSRSVLMEGLAPDQAQLAVHVSAHGGLISAAMQQNVLRGLQPGGVDFVSPAARPATSQFVPGIALATEAPADPNYADAAPVLRLVSTGSTDTVASIKLYGPDGAADLGDKGQVTIPAHGVVDVSLAAVGEGIFTAEVTADDPIVAAARIIRQGPTPDGVPVGGPADFAWSPAVPALNGAQLAVLPSDVTSNLDFSARGGDGSVIVRGVGADGTVSEPRTVAVPASTTVALDPTSLMPGVVAVLFSSAAGSAKIVAATVATVGDEAGELVSVVPIPPAPPGAESLTLRLAD